MFADTFCKAVMPLNMSVLPLTVLFSSVRNCVMHFRILNMYSEICIIVILAAFTALLSNG